MAPWARSPVTPMAARMRLLPFLWLEQAEPVLAHRIVVRGMYGRSGQGELIVAEALKSTPVPTESPERA